MGNNNHSFSGRNANPSYALIDSQSVKTVYASDERGFDGGKKRKDENAI
jgi:putative transposase